MLRFLIITILFLMSTVSAIANTSIVVNLTPPANKEIIVAPRGYVNCRIIPAGYYNGIWINQYNVCTSARRHGVWVSGHWRCVNVQPSQSICLRWDWIPAHWQGKHIVVYSPPPVPPSHTTIVYVSKPHPVVYAAPATIHSQPIVVPVQPQPVPMVRVAVNN